MEKRPNNKRNVYPYTSKGGTVCIGNGLCRATFSNGLGDGRFLITVADKEPDRLQWKYRGSVAGSDICVLKHDYYEDNNIPESDVLCHLSGRYGVYSNDGDIYLQKWD